MPLMLPFLWLISLVIAVLLSALLLIAKVRKELIDDHFHADMIIESSSCCSVEESLLPLPVILGVAYAYFGEDSVSKKYRFRRSR